MRFFFLSSFWWISSQSTSLSTLTNCTNLKCIVRPPIALKWEQFRTRSHHFYLDATTSSPHQNEGNNFLRISVRFVENSDLRIIVYVSKIKSHPVDFSISSIDCLICLLAAVDERDFTKTINGKKNFLHKIIQQKSLMHMKWYKALNRLLFHQHSLAIGILYLFSWSEIEKLLKVKVLDYISERPDIYKVGIVVDLPVRYFVIDAKASD